MVYGILGLINFAHGEVVMIGAMVMLTMLNFLLGYEYSIFFILILSVLVSVLICMTLSFFIEKVAYRPLRNAPRLAPLITAIGVSILLQNLSMIIWGRQYKTFPELIEIQSFVFLGASVTQLQLAIILISSLFMIMLMLLINYSKLGKAMRATSENPEMAGLMGINVNFVISFTFVLGAALAAIAGVLVSANYGIAHYTMGFMLGLKAFTAAVLGGIGNVPGAMLGVYFLV